MKVKLFEEFSSSMSIKQIITFLEDLFLSFSDGGFDVKLTVCKNGIPFYETDDGYDQYFNSNILPKDCCYIITVFHEDISKEGGGAEERQVVSSHLDKVMSGIYNRLRKLYPSVRKYQSDLFMSHVQNDKPRGRMFLTSLG